jgi:hypothetical protein
MNPMDKKKSQVILTTQGFLLSFWIFTHYPNLFLKTEQD